MNLLDDDVGTRVEPFEREGLEVASSASCEADVGLLEQRTTPPALEATKSPAPLGAVSLPTLRAAESLQLKCASLKTELQDLRRVVSSWSEDNLLWCIKCAKTTRKLLVRSQGTVGGAGDVQSRREGSAASAGVGFSDHASAASTPPLSHIVDIPGMLEGSRCSDGPPPLAGLHQAPTVISAAPPVAPPCVEAASAPPLLCIKKSAVPAAGLVSAEGSLHSTRSALLDQYVQQQLSSIAPSLISSAAGEPLQVVSAKSYTSRHAPVTSPQLVERPAPPHLRQAPSLLPSPSCVLTIASYETDGPHASAPHAWAIAPSVKLEWLRRQHEHLKVRGLGGSADSGARVSPPRMACVEAVGQKVSSVESGVAPPPTAPIRSPHRKTLHSARGVEPLQKLLSGADGAVVFGLPVRQTRGMHAERSPVPQLQHDATLSPLTTTVSPPLLPVPPAAVPRGGANCRVKKGLAITKASNPLDENPSSVMQRRALFVQGAR